MKKNTIEWWLSRIADPEIRERALRNMRNDVPYTGDGIWNDIKFAIMCGFKWNSSPEGAIYWKNLVENPPTLLEEQYTEPKQTHSIEPGQVWRFRSCSDDRLDLMVLGVTDEVVYYAEHYAADPESVIIEDFLEQYELIQS